jgi:predicted ester cyclase
VDLSVVYQHYLDTLNAHPVGDLAELVTDPVVRNGVRMSPADYRAFIQESVDAAPDLRFEATILVHDERRVAARLEFTCTPRTDALGADVVGRTVSFAEHAIYEFEDGRIARVVTIIEPPRPS